MGNKYATQGRLIIGRLRCKPHTYMEMLAIGVSTSPWKRVCECLLPTDRIVKARNKRGLITWRVVKA